jgi:hypothetical protein
MALNPIIAQAIASSGRAPDLVGQFRLGQIQKQQVAEEQRRTQSRQQLGALLGQQLPEQFAGLAETDPSQALALAKAQGVPLGDRARQAELGKSLQIIDAVARTNPEEAFKLAQREIDLLGNQGIDTTSFQAELDAGIQSPADFFSGISAQVRGLENAGVIEPLASRKPGARKTFAPVSIVNPETNEKRLVSPTVDSSGRASFSEFELPEGFEVSKETPEEKRAADVLATQQKAQARAQGTKQESRDQDFIDRGIAAADSTASLRRSIELLETVETGGIDAISLKAKQLFGVEGADEGELVGNLGKAVLSQLRETFGAQFTAAEGQRLEGIEARIGASPATNRRLLGNALALMERIARRGRKAAATREDRFSVDEIDQALKFKLSEPEPAAQPQRFKFNPETGQLEPQ